MILLCLVGTKAAQAECNDQMINVVSFVNPDPEIESFKKYLDDIPTLATLTNDPRAALPESFTICSDIMTVYSTRRNYHLCLEKTSMLLLWQVGKSRQFSPTDG